MDNSPNPFGEPEAAADDKVEVVRPRSTLKFKVKPSGGPSLDQIMADAEKALDDLKDNYEVWVREDLDNMAGHLKGLTDDLDDDARVKTVNAIHGIAHNIKGQAATFDYALLTEVAHSLCAMLSKDELAASRMTPLIALHVEAMRLIISQEIKGKGGEVGKELVGGLHAAVKKKFAS